MTEKMKALVTKHTGNSRLHVSYGVSSNYDTGLTAGFTAYMWIGAASATFNAPTLEELDALLGDNAHHAAVLQIKEKRIAELQYDLSRLQGVTP